jgi:potassium-transporting ATPase potassium-binding subunit
MNANGNLQIIVFLSVVFIFIKPLGIYMAKVYEGKPSILNRLLKPLENCIYYLCRIDQRPMNWQQYLSAMLIFNLLGLLVTYFILRAQAYFPLNLQGFSAVPPELSFNTAVSFVSNTSWQAYAGETTLSYFSQMTAITVQSFLSSATGMSLFIAFIRGLTRYETQDLGNFWVDTVRGVLYILLPLAMIIAILLISQGVIQNFKSYQAITPLESIHYQRTIPEDKIRTHQIIPMGPVASQIAIKQLGSDGGGFFNVNSAHPFENPTPLSNFIEMLAMLLIPTAFCYSFGVMVNDRRQGWAILTAMFLLFIPMVYLAAISELKGNPTFNQLGIDQTLKDNFFPGGNMEGKETRFGIINSTLWAAITTATSNGSVNAMLDSFTPFGSFVPLWLMHLGEVVFGGVGSGLYGMLMMIIITVFIASLMVGKIPTYLGKKIASYEMKMASFAVLVMPLVVLIFTSVAVMTHLGITAMGNPVPRGFTEILYAFTSLANNNGSTFAGLNANTSFYNLLGGLAMLLGRYWVAIPVLAIAGSLAGKKRIAVTSGTLPTHSPLFIVLLLGVICLIGALSFFPALCLGPIIEHLKLYHGSGL